MSSEVESYEDLVKKLKPFSVVVKKLSDEEFAKLKVVNDPNLIRDERIQLIINNNDDNNSEAEEEEEEEIEINISIVDTLNDSEVAQDLVQNPILDEDKKIYSCFFCKRKCIGYKEAFIHYQLHIDYYPIQCSICDEANTDLDLFVNHCKKTHPELNKAKYIKKFNSNSFNWILNYLKAEPNRAFIHLPQIYCPACDWIHSNIPDVNNPSNDGNQTNAIKPMQILSHIHEHIQYKPFQCSLCKENGEDFRVHVLDGKTVRKHFSVKHKDKLDDTPNWKFFNKKFIIPSLDKFIIHYLGIFGLKVPKKRRTKKPKTQSEIETNQNKTPTTASINGQNYIKPSLSTPSTSVTVKANTSLNNLMVKHNVNTAFNGNIINNNTKQTIVAKRLEDMENPLLITASSNSINMRPILVDSTDIGVVCIDPRILECDDRHFKYICIFCDEEISFASKIEACIHYSIHLNYYPINCLLCENKFIDLSALILHYEREHINYKNNLFHYLKEDEKIENWINGFLDFQKSHQFLTHVSVTYGDYCFVCKKLSKEKGMKMKCAKNELIGIRDHIYHHLHYFPYKCLVCFYGQRSVRFSSKNKCASDHFKNLHNLNTISIDDNLKLMAKTDEIIVLEKLIDKQLFPSRDQKPVIPIDINLKRKLDDMLAKDKMLAIKPIDKLEHNIIPNIKKGNGLINSSVKNNTSSQLKNSPINVNGMKHLTPKLLINMNPSEEYIPNKRTYREPFLLCFHCHTKVLNTSELESHHQSKHPKLTIASYSPTKIDAFAY